jgi:hypothetical protein
MQPSRALLPFLVLALLPSLIAAQTFIVSFPISCPSEAQAEFDQAVTNLHSFWYDDALTRFQNISRSWPECGMAYWGQAMCFWHPLWDPPYAADIELGRSLVQQGLNILHNQMNATAREWEYMSTLGSFFLPRGASYEDRVASYLTEMKRLHDNYGLTDPEAVAFYALAINAEENIRPVPDPYLVPQRHAGKILEDLLKQFPQHPGALHYLIHSYDYPQLAQGALSAALLYSKVAPLVPHAQHMPSHTFHHLGRWPDSVTSNARSMEAAQIYDSKWRPGIVDDDYTHALNFQVVALLQLAQDAAVKEKVEEISKINSVDTETAAAGMALSSARYLISTQRWSEATEFELSPVNFNWAGHPWAKLVAAFVRALGQARRSGAIADDSASALGEMFAAEQEWEASAMYHNGSAGPWRASLALLAPVARAWVAGLVAEERGEPVQEAWNSSLQILQDGVKLEEAGIEAVLSFPTDDAGEVFLTKMHDPVRALKYFEASLSRNSNRFRALAGATLAACEIDGNGDDCKKYKAMLLALCDPCSDKDRCGGRAVYRTISSCV